MNRPENQSGLITYYDRPVIKPPVWIWTIPVYFFVGGVAGSAMTLGFAVQLCGGRSLRRFDEVCRWTGAVGGGVGTALLIADLGRKARFLAMLRVLRPTSPMSIGSWVLALATPLSAGSALLTMRRGWLRRAGFVAGAGAGVLGMPLATYTGVLLGNTAVPVWLAIRRSLPLLFAASSCASLASVFELMPLGKHERAVVRHFGIAGRTAEILASLAVERDACRIPAVGKPLKEGPSGALWRSAELLTVASLMLTVFAKPGKTTRRLSGMLGVAGGLALRLAVFHAGKASSMNPRAAFSQHAQTVNAVPLSTENRQISSTSP